MIGRQALTIVWAQWRSIANSHHHSRRNSFPLAALLGFIWYGFWTFAAFGVAITAANPENLELLRTGLPPALLLVFLYWQLVPIIMVSTGVSLDLTRLLVYPIPHSQLFTIEVILRVTTCFEMLLVSAGLVIGLLLNPLTPAWGLLAVVVFVFFNLFLSAGLKDLLGRLLARKGYREALVFLLVLMAALPQLLLMAGPPAGSRGLLVSMAGRYSPWGATGLLAIGTPDAVALTILLISAIGAWYFGRLQFERTLRFDAAEAQAAGKTNSKVNAALEALLRLPSRIFRDPLAALVEKEIRFLTRSARFRLLFLMGFSFGLLIWLPMSIGRDDDSFFRTNYLTVVSGYALMLLGEVCFWNNLGLDRGAVQAYFTMPVSIATVLRAKNIAASFFVFAEVIIVIALCALLQMPVTAQSIAEAFTVTLVFATFLLAFGNLLSVRHPRPVNPAQSWRSGSVGRAQAYLLLLYPAATGPIALAFAAEYAFETRWAFYGVMLLNFAIALVVYSIALESAAKTAARTKERIVMTLSRAENPAGA